MTARRRIRSLLALALAGALAVTGSLTAAAAEAGTRAASGATGTIGWTVETADNDNGVGRGNFTYDVEPGAVISDTMVVVNTGTQALPLAVYAADAFTTSSGDIDVLVDGTPSIGAGTWVAIGTPAVELLPGQQADIAFTISVPADARPGDHAAGIVTSLVTTDASQSLSVDRRLGTRVNLRVAGELSPAAAIADVSTAYTPSWNPFAAGTLTVSYALENPGNTRITGVETLAVAGPLGLFGADTAPAQLREIIPGSVVEVTRELPVMSLGWVGGTLTVTPEGVGLGTGSVAPVTVDVGTVALPWSLYALLVLAAAIVAGGLLVLRRARRARLTAAGAAAP
ncbi:DUF916 domain-containing protein [Microbacterium oleivorans]|uniref:DUF916 domain-containing protein n=1 Tax=Microbacterium oleivorans TaxID=273677 RepID=A0A7D5ES71_9MICO|nr:DUF916 domain-containing protein [Microbacterium oleivorans]QLD11745.1 DUF916 domain-containing protein [Microbacterium oleivorans]